MQRGPAEWTEAPGEQKDIQCPFWREKCRVALWWCQGHIKQRPTLARGGGTPPSTPGQRAKYRGRLEAPPGNRSGSWEVPRKKPQPPSPCRLWHLGVPSSPGPRSRGQLTLPQDLHLEWFSLGPLQEVTVGPLLRGICVLFSAAGAGQGARDLL